MNLDFSYPSMCCVVSGPIREYNGAGDLRWQSEPEWCVAPVGPCDTTTNLSSQSQLDLLHLIHHTIWQYWLMSCQDTNVKSRKYKWFLSPNQRDKIDENDAIYQSATWNVGFLGMVLYFWLLQPEHGARKNCSGADPLSTSYISPYICLSCPALLHLHAYSVAVYKKGEYLTKKNLMW